MWKLKVTRNGLEIGMSDTQEGGRLVPHAGMCRKNGMERNYTGRTDYGIQLTLQAVRSQRDLGTQETATELGAYISKLEEEWVWALKRQMEYVPQIWARKKIINTYLRKDR